MRSCALLLVLGACAIEPSLVPCGPLACPIGRACDVVHELCVDPDQLVSCMGLADQVACNAQGVIGSCLDEICLVPVCGDGFVQPGEMCDDGNRAGNDGCSAGCTSNEACGNGIVDAGESCDDANQITADGCSSTCQPEPITWRLEGVMPYAGGANHMVYDAAHDQLLLVLPDGITWRWTGTRWTIVSTTGLPKELDWSQVLYVPDRGSVMVVGMVPSFLLTPARVWEWDGATWTERACTNPPAAREAVATYDLVRREILLFGDTSGQATSSSLWSLDVSTLTWTQELSPPGPAGGGKGSFAFDEERGVAVHTRFSVQEWNGTSWTSIAAGIYRPLVYVPGTGLVGVQTGGAATWDGATWTPLAGSVGPTFAPTQLAYDPDRQRLVAHTGGDQVASEVYEWDGANWTRVWIGPPYSYRPQVAYDVARRRFVHYGTRDYPYLATYSFDGEWHPLGTGLVVETQNESPDGIAYDPVRQAIVLAGKDGGTYLLAGDEWTTLEPPGPSTRGGAYAATYDPVRGGVVCTTVSGLFLLGSNSSAWVQIGDAASAPFDTLAFDAGTGELLGTTTYGGIARFDGTWTDTVTSGTEEHAGADPRRGTVVVATGNQLLLERRDRVWRSDTMIPFALNGIPIANPETGEIMIYGMIGASVVILYMRYGDGPVDSCTGADEDGDDLVDCADPECWWSCQPACPPRTSCAI